MVGTERLAAHASLLSIFRETLGQPVLWRGIYFIRLVVKNFEGQDCVDGLAVEGVVLQVGAALKKQSHNVVARNVFFERSWLPCATRLVYVEVRYNWRGHNSCFLCVDFLCLS